MQAKNYINQFYTLVSQLECSQQGETMDLETGVREIMALFQSLGRSDKKIIFIGNGGSAAIASHMAIDYWNNAGVPALCFNDGAQLTCLGNDYGFRSVFAQAVQIFARPGDVLVAISSSGQSENILQAVAAAHRIGCTILTLSGFSPQNPLREQGHFNIYCAAQEYGFVELAHEMFLHMLVDFMKAANHS